MMADEKTVFDERQSLSRIRDYARQRMVAPFATLLGVILRAGTAAPVHVMIPPMVGSPKPLNMVVINVGPSGYGKTACDDVAEEYWPAEFPVYPLGTAEGTCQAFQPDEDEKPTVPNILFSSSEIDNWAALGERAGSMTFPVLRQLITGDQIGQKNASKAHTRVVAKRSYGAGISLSAQPGSNGARVLLGDVQGGFPQRCLFASVLDPDAPDEPPTGVTPYIPDRTPDFTPNVGDHYEIPFPESVATEIRLHRRRVLRGDPSADPLDGHRNLTKSKVAAGLMLLDGRQTVTEDDWRIAEEIMAISDATRSALVDAIEQAARTANRVRAHAVAERDEIMSDHKLQRTKQAVLRWLGRDGESSSTDLRRKVKADLRDNLHAALSELADAGQIIAIEVDRGTRYRLAPQGTRCTTSTPPKVQVSDRVPEVHGVPLDNVTKLDSRRSNDNPRPKLSTAKWLAQHLSVLRGKGLQTVRAFAVYEAGEAAGYNRSTIASVASSNPDVVVIDLSDGVSTWSITGEHQPYQTAVEWFGRYLERLPDDCDEVDQDAYRHAAAAAGYTWDAARHAALRSGRIDSRPAHGEARAERVWHLIPTTEGDQTA